MVWPGFIRSKHMKLRETEASLTGAPLYPAGNASKGEETAGLGASIMLPVWPWQVKALCGVGGSCAKLVRYIPLCTVGSYQTGCSWPTRNLF